MRCQYCGKDETLPFVCNYCGGVFCSEHRLPESHNCTGDLSRKPAAEMPTTSSFAWSTYPQYGTVKGRITFSAKEVRDILVAWLALGLAFTIANGFNIAVTDPQNRAGYIFLNSYETFVVSLVAVGLGFVFHELMHKFSAERYGHEAAFRMWPLGLILALLTSFAHFIFAAPGATYINGQGISQRENGIISVAGPLTNVAIAVLFLPLLLVSPSLASSMGVGPAAFLEGVASIGVTVNLFLATFNMIPIMPLDGAKVWRWNKAYWAAVFVPLAVLLYLLYSGGL